MWFTDYKDWTGYVPNNIELMFYSHQQKLYTMLDIGTSQNQRLFQHHKHWKIQVSQ